MIGHAGPPARSGVRSGVSDDSPRSRNTRVALRSGIVQRCADCGVVLQQVVSDGFLHRLSVHSSRYCPSRHQDSRRASDDMKRVTVPAPNHTRRERMMCNGRSGQRRMCGNERVRGPWRFWTEAKPNIVVARLRPSDACTARQYGLQAGNAGEMTGMHSYRDYKIVRGAIHRIQARRDAPVLLSAEDKFCCLRQRCA